MRNVYLCMAMAHIVLLPSFSAVMKRQPGEGRNVTPWPKTWLTSFNLSYVDEVKIPAGWVIPSPPLPSNPILWFFPLLVPLQKCLWKLNKLITGIKCGHSFSLLHI
jgi:hypothetical protein